ncbi:epsilon-sarcoglycan-like [Limulus polyphemus]|uniref:Epsilon-sarcoglycan-like n=1 Tax=Limulus polyphemus TaxID=6850 RepID=A0ABM1BK99_LIMPO|nr:epsilon-sarcoglycan-like [Limulus polyphemus]
MQSLQVFSVVQYGECKTVYTTEVFFMAVKKNMFEYQYGEAESLVYRASLFGMPDLPHWMNYRHVNTTETAYLYGAPDEPGEVHIEIIALNKDNYETRQTEMIVNVEPRNKEAVYEVEMKFSNMNVEDMFQNDRLRQIEEIFRDYLWPESETIYITMVASAVDVGGRLPLDPTEKEGVVVRIGGTTKYSQDILDLEREVQPIRNRYPCPRDYKRTSAEHFFRARNLISDWCGFQLIPDEDTVIEDKKPSPSFSPILLSSDDFIPHFPNYPRRDFLMDFIITIVVPVVVVIILTVVLSSIMCCHRESLERRNLETSSVQMNQYNSIQRASSQLRNLAVKRESLPRTGSTPASTLPRSRTGSPSSTLPKTSTPRTGSCTGTLRGAPPPPPYTPPSEDSKRSTLIKDAE